MRLKLRAFALTGLAIGLAACAKHGSAGGGSSDLKTDQQKFGYAVGVDLGRSIRPVQTDVDLKSLEAGMEDAAADKALAMDDQARQQIKIAMSTKIRQHEADAHMAMAKENAEKGDKFLADNGKRSGVKTTADGLQYEVLKEGDGTPPTPADRVTVNYKGTLIDGTVFDQSSQPITFELGNVIPGWTEGLQLMKPGSKAKLFIPGKLAYGEQGQPPKIQPNQTLVFEVELLKVEHASGGSAPAAPAGKGAQ